MPGVGKHSNHCVSGPGVPPGNGAANKYEFMTLVVAANRPSESDNIVARLEMDMPVPGAASARLAYPKAARALPVTIT